MDSRNIEVVWEPGFVKRRIIVNERGTEILKVDR